MMTSVCLATALLVALFGLPHHPAPIKAIVTPPIVSVLVLITALFGIHHPSMGVRIEIGEAFVLVAAGSMLGFCAPFYENRAGRTSALTLSTLWLLQAAFRYCYVMHINVPWWETANEVFPPMLMVAACIFLGRRLRVLTPRGQAQLVYQ